MCYKATQNFALKRAHEQEKHVHVIEKKQQADFVAKALAEQKASEEQINEMVGVFRYYSEFFYVRATNFRSDIPTLTAWKNFGMNENWILNWVTICILERIVLF